MVDIKLILNSMIFILWSFIFLKLNSIYFIKSIFISNY